MASDIPRLAAHAANKLDYTTDSLEELRERDEEIDAIADDMTFCRELDRLEFCCVCCGYWKPQRENGTPNASEWKCQECVRDDAAAEEYAKRHGRGA